MLRQSLGDDATGFFRFSPIKGNAEVSAARATRNTGIVNFAHLGSHRLLTALTQNQPRSMQITQAIFFKQ
ncbi:hypothetical protein A8A01_22400 [Ewingella americana]|nr:hypothetical protein A8A01_22400 [Ewingella americana]